MSKQFRLVLVVLLALFVYACAPMPIPTVTPATNLALAPTPVSEVAPITIPLAGTVANARAEISGMAWYGDNLILLPQYPDFEKRRGLVAQAPPTLFAFAKADILAFLDGTKKEALVPKRVKVDDDDLIKRIDADGFSYQGYESIVLVGNRVFVTIETENKSNRNTMQAYLMAGEILPDLSSVKFDATKLTPIKSPAPINNLSQEAMLAVGDKLLTFYEANGAGVNKSPIASVFDEKSLALVGTLPFPNLDYRLTDVTPPDSAGKFWGISYEFPGDAVSLQAPRVDALAKKYGQGPTHAKYPQVERLVEFQYNEQGIMFTERAPIQLVLLNADTARNWEGIARLDQRGLLIATDSFPETILAFVPFK